MQKTLTNMPWRLGGQPGVFPLIAGLSLAASVAFATDPIYTNSATVTDPPLVDAITFVNTGNITNVITMTPVQFSSTRNITNTGTFSGEPGWYFNDTSPNIGTQKLAANFYNDNNGLIEGLDGPQNTLEHTIAPSYLWVDATNIVNRGRLRVGANGWLRLVGTNVDLKRSGLEVPSIVPIGNVIGSNFFFPDVAISDYYWGVGNADINISTIWDGLVASSPGHPVQGLGIAGNTIVQVFNPVSDCYSNLINGARGGVVLTVTNMATNGTLFETNVFVATNLVKQAVFVGLGDDPNIAVGIGYGRSSSPTNPMVSVGVQIQYLSTNVVNATPEANNIFFYDTLAAEPERGLSLNQVNTFSSRPANYILSRLPELNTGLPGNGPPDPRYFFDPRTMTNRVADDAPWSGYAAYINNTVSEPAAIPSGTFTNVPGRVQIFADTLDLSRTRIRGEGYIQVKANHVISTDQAAVDCESLSYFLGSTNGSLKVANLTKETVARMKGYTFAWSTLWNNTQEIQTTNYVVSTNAAGDNVTNNVPITNIVNIRSHCLILDATALLSKLPVVVYDMVTRGTPNVTINDNMVVAQSLFFDATDLTLNGGITLTNITYVNVLGQPRFVGMSDWVWTNSPNLLNLTNTGLISVSNHIHFGDDRATPYRSLVNTGTVNAGTLVFRSDYFLNAGKFTTRADIVMLGRDGSLIGGQSSSGNATRIACDSLRLNHYNLQAGGFLELDVTNALFDAGGASLNNITVNNGFRMLRKPATGDLLGTSFTTKAPDFVQVDHYWAAGNFGAVPAGYQNNAAIGKLVCGPVGNGVPLLYFQGISHTNALYVDLLDITLLGQNYQDLLDIDPNFVIYYAAAKAGFAPPGNYTIEEYLDNRYDGRLRWVKDFAGPNSSVNVVSNGVTLTMNKALRDSQQIDSDGDGVPNFFDGFPLGGSSGNASGSNNVGANFINTGIPGVNAFAITWNAAPNSVYQVDYRSDLTAGAWQLLARFTNNAPTSRVATVYDTNAPALAPQRFYRVGLMP